jgi:hypothetical protein
MISLIEFVSICAVATLTAAGASQGWERLRRPRVVRSEPRVSHNDDDGFGRPSAGRWHEPRYGKRYSVSCRIEYGLDDNWHQGVLFDMSCQGWRAKGMQPVVNGTSMPVKIYFADIPQCIITIEEAVVRWTDGLEFGVELTRISPESAAMLSDYLSSHYPLPEPPQADALSPFSYN